MAKIQHFPDLSNLKPEEFVRHGSQVISNTVDIVNGGLEFDKNMRTQTVEVTFPAANQEVAVTHNLGKTGIKYWPVRKSVNCSIFDGSREDTKNTIYLQSDAAATVTLILF